MRSDAEHYARERARELSEVKDKSDVEIDEVVKLFDSIALLVFGFVKGTFTGATLVRSAIQTA